MSEKSLYSYHKGILSEDKCATLFEKLKGDVDKQPKKIRVFGKWFDEPRLTRLFSKKKGHTFSYSGVTMQADDWPWEIVKLELIARRMTGERFDTALVNYYRDGNDSVGIHRDSDAMDGSIVSFSFGATRDFHIRDDSNKAVLDTVPLENGSVFIMKPGFQQRYLHELPKRSTVKTGRINVTFRRQLK